MNIVTGVVEPLTGYELYSAIVLTKAVVVDTVFSSCLNS